MDQDRGRRSLLQNPVESAAVHAKSPRRGCLITAAPTDDFANDALFERPQIAD